MNTNEIIEKIRKDCQSEFVILKKEILGLSYLDPDIDSIKEFYTDKIAKAINVRSKLLLDTLVNYLMDASLTAINQEDTKIQNAFFKQDLRHRILNWAQEPENILKLTPSDIQFSTDPRRKAGYISSCLVFSLWLLSAIVVRPNNSIILSVITISALISSLVAFKIGFRCYRQKARNRIVSDSLMFISNSENQVYKWLSRVADCFNVEFSEFCTSNSI